MTREVRFIIENKRFKASWEDYAVYWEFIAPVLIFIFGFELTIKGAKLIDYVLGPVTISASFPLIPFMLRRKRQLTEFEEIPNTRTKEVNFEIILQGLKTLNVVEVDRDIHNWTINAKYKTSSLPPVYEWLTIVCMDNLVLVNSRPVPVTMLLWIRRNAMIEFKRLV